MITLATLFDLAYFSKGAALLSSIQRHIPAPMVYVLCLDSTVYDRLAGMAIKGVALIRLSEIESRELIEAKSNRSSLEFIWTLGSYFTAWCADKFSPPSIAYLDADCFFFSDPLQLYDEVSAFPVAITPHRWTPSEEARLQSAGRYNVSWVYFNRDGYPCLRHWRDQCLAWCKYEVAGDGRFADQGYLDDWVQKWGAYPVPHLGVNLAPWNQAQYSYRMNGGQLFVSDLRDSDPLVFFHFHGFGGIGKRSGYRLHPMVEEYVYRPYEEEYARWLG